MTMQVGMVGTDGVLIASDTYCTNEKLEWPPPTQQPMSVLESFGSSKFILDHERGIAIACARTMSTARIVAEQIIEHLGDADKPRKAIKAISERVLAPLKFKLMHCLIMLQHPVPQLYSLHCGLDAITPEEPICQEITTAIPAGDNVNPAIFWSARYYKEGKPVKSLVALAAHTIVSASKLNSRSIEGLEIVICDASGIRRIKKNSINKLKAQANAWDEQIGYLFSDYKIRLQFDP